ncbi:hypothetical protein F5887DRAFT_1158527 [Amanita rubescens]|nr:hypothetical protein F5887DRAFT_1158527 [Amanita rubescens]
MSSIHLPNASPNLKPSVASKMPSQQEMPPPTGLNEFLSLRLSELNEAGLTPQNGMDEHASVFFALVSLDLVPDHDGAADDERKKDSSGGLSNKPHPPHIARPWTVTGVGSIIRLRRDRAPQARPVLQLVPALVPAPSRKPSSLLALYASAQGETRRRPVHAVLTNNCSMGSLGVGQTLFGPFFAHGLNRTHYPLEFCFERSQSQRRWCWDENGIHHLSALIETPETFLLLRTPGSLPGIPGTPEGLPPPWKTPHPSQNVPGVYKEGASGTYPPAPPREKGG